MDASETASGRRLETHHLIRTHPHHSLLYKGMYVAYQRGGGGAKDTDATGRNELKNEGAEYKKS